MMAPAVLMEDTLQKSTQRRRTHAERRDQSERGLVEAMIAVVSEEGVSAATFEAIGRRGGYSRGLVGQRFGSKLGLIEAVIAYLHDYKEDSAESSRTGQLSGLNALLTYVDLYIQRLSHMGEGQAYFRLLSWAVADISAFRSAFTAEHDRVRERFEGWIRWGQTDGDIRADLDPKSAALMVGSQLLGLSMQVLVDPATEVGPIRGVVLSTLRRAFAPSPGSDHAAHPNVIAGGG